MMHDAIFLVVVYGRVHNNYYSVVYTKVRAKHLGVERYLTVSHAQLTVVCLYFSNAADDLRLCCFVKKQVGRDKHYVRRNGVLRLAP